MKLKVRPKRRILKSMSLMTRDPTVPSKRRAAAGEGCSVAGECLGEKPTCQIRRAGAQVAVEADIQYTAWYCSSAHGVLWGESPDMRARFTQTRLRDRYGRIFRAILGCSHSHSHSHFAVMSRGHSTKTTFHTMICT